MPHGLKRYYGQRHLHFITFSCYRRLPLLTPRKRDQFVKALEETRRKYGFAVLGFVVMPEHVHLLISEPEAGTPSTVVQVLKQRSAGRRRHRESNQLSIFASEQHSFWQARFYDFNVFTNRKRVEKLRYMHRNPVKRGLAPSPEMWPWSSFRWYCFGEWRGVALCDWPEAKLQLKKIQRQPTLRSGNRTAKSARRGASAKDGTAR